MGNNSEYYLKQAIKYRELGNEARKRGDDDESKRCFNESHNWQDAATNQKESKS